MMMSVSGIYGILPGLFHEKQNDSVSELLFVVVVVARHDEKKERIHPLRDPFWIFKLQRKVSKRRQLTLDDIMCVHAAITATIPYKRLLLYVRAYRPSPSSNLIARQ